jgi:hypothetical protein
VKNNRFSLSNQPAAFFILGLMALALIAYGRLLLHPDLHTACPENDTWNLPVRWSVLSSLQEGKIPLWNSLSAFGMPWLATWQTETFYPGTWLFTQFGLNAWNYSGILHLLIFSTGIYFFLIQLGAKPFAAFFSASLGLLNGCAYNHLGSNAAMDAMAWIPWVFIGARGTLIGKAGGPFKLGLAVTLQILAGYPQTLLYTLLGLFLYAAICFRSVEKLILPLALALLVTAGQWLPSVEYFFFQALRLSAAPDNPSFVLPLNNLLTFLRPDALSQKGLPDYVVSPTYFYFNLYIGIIPLAIFFLSVFRSKEWTILTRFWLFGLLATGFWTFGFFTNCLHLLHIPSPDFLEPAKTWVLLNFVELITLGLLWENLYPKAGWWKWLFLTIAIADLLIPIWSHPLERNLLPSSDQMVQNSKLIKNSLNSGRLLVLVDEKESGQIFQPLPDPGLKPHFKYFVPNSNLYASIPLANFYGSTAPNGGVLDTELYFKYSFPYAKGHLLDLLGVDALLLNVSQMPKPFIPAGTLEGWTLWKNPNSLGRAFIYQGDVSSGERKSIFETFASGESSPETRLFLEKEPISDQPRHALSPREDPENHYVIPQNKSGYLVITQNGMPGWRVWVDGQPRDLLLADSLFQCVPVQGGQTVDLRYEPASFRFGLFVSLLTLAGLLFTAVTFLSKRPEPSVA